MPSPKPYTTIGQQITLLQRRGMLLDPDEASQWLRNVGYYRLSGYWYDYRVRGSAGAPIDRFLPDTDFSMVAALYEFDRKLRTLIHDAVERVEVGVRSHLSYHIGQHGPLAHEDPQLFRTGFDHERWLTVAERRVDRAARSHSAPIRHHRKAYSGSVPIWVLTEVLDFADISRLYEGMFARDQWAVAESLGLKLDVSALSGNQRRKASREHPLARWLEQLSILRNACAHHARVWNRSLIPAPTAALRTIPRLTTLASGQSERVYGSIAVIAYLLGHLAPGSTWNLKMRELLEDGLSTTQNPSPAALGAPEDWASDPLWTTPCGNWTPPSAL
ncbi:CAAX protease [Brachybacterium vulturis]|uniref:CAAX protease n=1 Tax=Brachybacterium vulturis TaxID=2017484 RepID=A0A291GJH3_9MICO|nr:Abi family protein [Brachybacterium vulturis]ATG50124.1 CAAX protease [Brachybacterium vulturis]